MKDSKHLIVTTAVDLFLKKRYHEVTMQDIVNATGLSKGAFYHYFSSKEKVFEEAVRYYIEDSRKEAFAKFSQESLWDFCQDYIKFASETICGYNDATDDKGGSLRANQFALIIDAMKILPGISQMQEVKKKAELQRWTNIIAKARNSGEINSSLTDTQIAKLFIYQIYGISAYFLSRSQVNELVVELSAQFKAIYGTLKN